ncbi:MAG: cupin domain-containing protein [Deltaproteobacteria bacterium]|nr:cupin domain-containing protein [Deltaproteobacteria bacterium]
MSYFSSTCRVLGEGQLTAWTLHRTALSSLDLLEYPAGEFELRVEVEQSACVLSGSATVDLADGRFLRLGPGDAMYLPRGMQGRWIVRETLRTVAVRNS